MGGRAILALDPSALQHLAAGRQVVLVSGTNGKTTTTSLLTAALSTTGPVVSNLLGANQPPGITAALAASPAGRTAALEVDEAWLGRVVAATRPRVVLLLNLTRDQLDRNNEVRTLAGSWRRTFLAGNAATTVVANADDPLVVWGAGATGADHARDAASVRWVGAGQPWTDDARGCPSCGGRIEFTAAQPDGADNEDLPAGDKGGWACTGCELRRPDLDVWLEDDEVVTAEGFRGTLSLALPGRANRANAAMALTAAYQFGVAPADALAAMAGTAEVVGRYRTVRAGGIGARLLLAKNPAGWLEVLDVLSAPPAPIVVAINSRIADGRDPSWLWDVPFERLGGRLVIASGERGRDLAVRLQYADVDHRLVLDPVDAIASAASARPFVAGAAAEAIDVVSNYTAFQTLRARLG